MNSRCCQNKTGLPSVVVTILLPLRQGQEQPLRTREQCRPPSMSVNNKGTYPKSCFLLKPWLLGTLPKDCLQSSHAHFLPITVAPQPLLCSSVHSGPGTSVEVRSRFPGRDKICVVFNLFLSRSRPSIQN